MIWQFRKSKATNVFHILQHGHPGTGVCLTFDANNHINNGIEAYDAAGNLMTDGFHNYFYDAEHHLIQLDGSDGWCASGTGTAATACYTYDAEGRRVRRTVGSGITDDYLYDLSGHFITQVSGSGTWIRGEIYAGGTHIATYENDLTTPTTFFTHADHLGTERVETGISGASCETTTSLPFGDGLNTSGSCDPTALRFTGKMRDSESNLDNFGARYNSSSLGRFMSPDWAAKPVSVPYAEFGSPQSLNLYSYVGNNPLSHADVDGHCWPFCGLVAWASQGVALEGGKNFAEDVGAGVAKGAGSFVVNTGKTLVAAVQMATDQPAASVSTLTSPGPAALQPSNDVQAETSTATQLTLTGVSLLTGAVGVAADATSVTAAGDTFTHYGFLSDADSFTNGLRPGSFATTESDLTGAQAQSGLSLPPRATTPDAAYPVTPTPGTPINGPSPTAPANGQPGGLPEVQFPNGTGPGTVGTPKKIPPD